MPGIGRDNIKEKASRMQTSDSGGNDRKRSDSSSLAPVLALVAQLGFSIACPMVVFIGGGAWLDNKLGWTPWLLFAGIILGVATAGGIFYQIAKLPARSRTPDTGTDPAAPYKVEQRRSKFRDKDLGGPNQANNKGNGGNGTSK